MSYLVELNIKGITVEIKTLHKPNMVKCRWEKGKNFYIDGVDGKRRNYKAADVIEFVINKGEDDEVQG